FEDPFNRRCFPWGHEIKDLQQVYKQLTQLKGQYSALKQGNILFDNPNDTVIHCVRTLAHQHIHTFVNGGSDTVSLPITGQLLFQTHASKEKRLLHLEPWGAAIMIE